MKKRLATLVLSGVLFLSLAACVPEGAVSPTPTPTPVPVPTAASTGEERVFALACYPEDSLHPITGRNRTNLLLAPLVYQGLFSLDESFTPHKQLCADYTVSEDGLTWSFTLAEAVFSDGSPLTVADAVSSLKLAANSTLYGARFSGVSKVSASGGALVLTLSSPNGNLPVLLDIPIVKEAGEGLPPYGTGEYAFAADGDDWRLERVAPSGGASTPAGIPLRSIRQTDELIQAFDAEQVSLVAADPTGTGALGFSGSFEVWDYPTATMLYIGFNAAKGPCADEKVRQALLYGFDRATVAASFLSRHATPAVLPVPPASPLYDATLAASLGYSHQTMADLLDGAGWKLDDSGVRAQGREPLSLVFLVNMENSAKLSIAEFLAQGLTRAGISVTLKKLSWEDYTAALAKGNFDLYLGETKLTADFDLSSLVSSKGGLNYGRYEDEETDALLGQFRATGELERPAAATELYVRLSNTAPFVPLCFKNGTVLTSWGTLSGLSPTQQNAFFRFDRWRF